MSINKVEIFSKNQQKIFRLIGKIEVLFINKIAQPLFK